MKERKIPMRRCVGCMQSREKNSMIRIAGYEGRLTVDLTGRAKGRGVYLCRDSRECWALADKRKALERNFDMPITEEMKREIFAQLEALEDGNEDGK
ncbi:MAG: YlxR family protein [Firmicutes bacterium]|nr:YlxR family protein [Bacillota bacterium]